MALNKREGVCFLFEAPALRQEWTLGSIQKTDIPAGVANAARIAYGWGQIKDCS